MDPHENAMKFKMSKQININNSLDRKNSELWRPIVKTIQENNSNNFLIYFDGSEYMMYIFLPDLNPNQPQHYQ